MKGRTVLLKILLFFALLVLVNPQVGAQNYGQIQAMKDRAETVTRQKNHFVVQVLRSYNIPCKVTEEGIVAQLHIQNHWYDVKQIEIVPITREIEGGYEVIAHEIFFYTEGDILHLVSAVKIQ